MWAVILCACGPIVPADVPAQLNATPGPPVIITDSVYISTHFATRYPGNWQVITSPAFSQTWVVFATDEAVIGLALDRDDIAQITPQVDHELRRESQVISFESGSDRQVIYALLVAPSADWERYQEIFRQVIESIAHPSAYG